MTKSTKKKKSSKSKKPTAKESHQNQSIETKLTGTKATDLYSSLNDSIFQDSFDKFVGDRETRRKQLNLREDVRASFNRDSSFEYSTNDGVATDQNPPQSYRYSICSTPHMKFNHGPGNLQVYFPGTPNNESKAYNSSNLFESYVESERNGSRAEAATTNHKHSNISIYTVGSSVIESSILHGSKASANMNAEEINRQTNRNILGNLNAETKSLKQSSSSSNNSSKAKRKVSSKKRVSSYKWEPYVTTRKHKRLINKAQVLTGLNSLVSLDDQQLESITSQEQSSVQSNYTNPVGRILRSSSLKNKLSKSSNSANNSSCSHGSYSTDTSSHSSSNMFSTYGLSETQNSSFSIASVSQVPQFKSSESKTSIHKIDEIDCNQNSTQEHSSIKYDEISRGDSMSVSISKQEPLATQSHNCNNVGRFLRGSTERSIRANESISSQSQNSSANLHPQESDRQILAQLHPYQENADTSMVEVRLSMPIRSPEQAQKKKAAKRYKPFELNSEEIAKKFELNNLIQSLAKRRRDRQIYLDSLNKKCDSWAQQFCGPYEVRNSKKRGKKSVQVYVWPKEVSQSNKNIQSISSSGKDKSSVNCKDSESKALIRKDNTTSNESSDQLMESQLSAPMKTKANEKSVNANDLQIFQNHADSSKENLPTLMNNQGGIWNVNVPTWTIHDQSGVSPLLHSVSESRRQSKKNIQSMTSDTICSIGNNKSVNCSESTELRLKKKNVICSNNVTLRKRHPINVNNLPVIMESVDLTNEDIATSTLTTDINRKEIQIPEINATISNAQENTIRLKSGKWRRQFSIYHRQTLPPRPAFILEQTDVESTNQLKISLPNESHRQTLRHSVSFNLSRDTFVDFNETSDRRAVRRRRTSVLNPIGVGRLIESEYSPITYNARDTVLRKCQQSEPLEFDEIYSQSALQKCRKIGEGVYGEVFMNKTDAGRAVVLKIIPIEGCIEVNGEQQKKFDEILSEIIIALELSSLRNEKEFMTSSFTEVVQVRCVQGRYPPHLIDLWELYRDNYQTENDHPEIFTDDQLYIVLELANGGQDLEAFQFSNALQSKSALQQTTLALAVAEKKFQFEHRDLHWGNILLAPTDDEFINFKLNGNLLQIPSEGIKVTIIDYTLSRMRYEDIVLYNDLSNDKELFTADGDYQFDIYRLMKDNLDNNWSRFEPFNNVLWLHYITDKLINGARYKNGKSRKHRSAIEQLMVIRDELTNYKSAEDSIAAIE